MLFNIKEFYGRKLAALDGLVGHVRDFYFDDQAWVLRYVVADTGSWLPGRLVLLSPHAFGPLEPGGKTLHVNLRIKQIENSPPIEAHKPVSRQFEERYHRYYAWPAYWQGPEIWGMSSYPLVVPPPELAAEEARESSADVHLRSAQALTGYSIEAVDGTVGRLSGFLVNDISWALPDLVVDSGPWYSGKEVVISHANVDRICGEDSSIHVNLTKAEIQQTGEDELVQAGPAKVGTEYLLD
jgi:hypothetical protein